MLSTRARVLRPVSLDIVYQQAIQSRVNRAVEPGPLRDARLGDCKLRAVYSNQRFAPRQLLDKAQQGCKLALGCNRERRRHEVPLRRGRRSALVLRDYGNDADVKDTAQFLKMFEQFGRGTR